MKVSAKISNFINFGLVKKEIVYVFGDSHVQVYNYLNKVHPFGKYYFKVIRVDGATAQGIVNPNSKTNALEIFRKNIEEIPKRRSKLIFLLGEVDSGFVIWYRAQKYNEPINLQLKNSIANYFNFLCQVRSSGYKNIFVMSAPLPTIKDYRDLGEVANLRKEVRSSQKERTDLTLEYNLLLRENCGKYNIYYMAFDSVLLDDRTGLVKSTFLNKNSNDHHLDNVAYGKICYSWCITHFKTS